MKNVQLHWRNSFHPAWLIVAAAAILPAIRSLVEGDYFIPDLILIITGLLFGAVIAGLGMTRPWRIPCQIGKEIRIQLPATVIGLTGPIVSRWLRLGTDDIGAPLAGLHIISCAYLAAGAFGAEFDSKTILGLLVHPGGRGRIYLQKLLILAFFLGMVTAAMLVVPASGSVDKLPDDDTHLRTLAIAGLALASGPLYSLLARGTLAGGIFALVVPPGFLLLGETVLAAYWRYVNSGAWVPSPLPGLELYMWVGGLVYAAVTAWAGWRVFNRLQVAGDGTGGEAIHGLGRPVDSLFRSLFIGARSSTATLIRKELRLQIIPWLMAGCYFLLAVIMMLAKQFQPSSDIPFDEFQMVMAAGAPYFLLMIGAGTIAEERRLGTLDWQLTFPCSVQKQWAVKILVAVGLALVLGVVLPITTIWCAVSQSMWANLLETATPLVLFLGICLAVAIVLMGAFASSLSRSAAGAAFFGIGIAVGTAAVLAIFPAIAVHHLEQRSNELANQWNNHQLNMTPFFVSEDTLLQVKDWGLTIVVFAFGGLWLAMATNNFRQGIPTGRRLTRQLALNGLLALIVGVFTSGWITLYFEGMFRRNFQAMPPPHPPVQHRRVVQTPGPPNDGNQEANPVAPASTNRILRWRQR